MPLRFDLAIQLQNIVQPDITMIEIQVVLLLLRWDVPVLEISQITACRLWSLLHRWALVDSFADKSLTSVSLVTMSEFNVFSLILGQ